MRKRVGLMVRFHSKNITGVEVIAFVRLLLRHLHGAVVLLWDGAPIHRRTIVRDYLHTCKRLHVYRFPGYAPELNPAELVWSQAKRSLSNGAPKDIASLRARVRCAIGRVKTSRQRLRSCIEATDLAWNWRCIH